MLSGAWTRMWIIPVFTLPLSLSLVADYLPMEY